MWISQDFATGSAHRGRAVHRRVGQRTGQPAVYCCCRRVAIHAWTALVSSVGVGGIPGRPVVGRGTLGPDGAAMAWVARWFWMRYCCSSPCEGCMGSEAWLLAGFGTCCANCPYCGNGQRSLAFHDVQDCSAVRRGAGPTGIAMAAMPAYLTPPHPDTIDLAHARYWHPCCGSTRVRVTGRAAAQRAVVPHPGRPDLAHALSAPWPLAFMMPLRRYVAEPFGLH